MKSFFRKQYKRFAQRTLPKYFAGRMFTSEEIESVKRFYTEYNDFRIPTSCARVTNISVWKCEAIRNYLYYTRQLGAYFFEAGADPQKYMRKYIIDNVPGVSQSSRILEVGPGNRPIFNHSEYPNWYAVDKYYDGTAISFRDREWAKNAYPDGHIFKGSWETLSSSVDKSLAGTFDLVVSSHSFEHTTRPVKSLNEARSLLAEGGTLVLFVPDGYSDDQFSRGEPTHTLYIVPEMIEEFFQFSDGFSDIKTRAFRPNCDLVVTAVKRDIQKR